MIDVDLSPDELSEQFMIQLGDDAVIPCTSSDKYYTWAGPGDMDPSPPRSECGRPATWAMVKPCGHQGYVCDRHHGDYLGEEHLSACRVCNRLCWSREIIHHRL